MNIIAICYISTQCGLCNHITTMIQQSFLKDKIYIFDIEREDQRQIPSTIENIPALLLRFNGQILEEDDAIQWVSAQLEPQAQHLKNSQENSIEKRVAPKTISAYAPQEMGSMSDPFSFIPDESEWKKDKKDIIEENSLRQSYAGWEQNFSISTPEDSGRNIDQNDRTTNSNYVEGDTSNCIVETFTPLSKDISHINTSNSSLSTGRKHDKKNEFDNAYEKMINERNAAHYVNNIERI